MATYAVGDIQGCLRPLQRLLTHIAFNPSKDKLWVAGDLVNRGPDSLYTLRFLYHLRHSLHIVLGNHDLHLLASAAGYRQCSPSDTLDSIINAPDRDVLLEWLRHQPLLHHDKTLGITMVHAGIPPQWSLKQANTYAKEVSNVLQGPHIHHFLRTMYGNHPAQWDNSLTGDARWRLITNYLTRMRFCSPEGELDLQTKGSSSQAPAGYLPWYQHLQRKTAQKTIVFGHWAALEGKTNHLYTHALDTGCVWGGKLTIMRLEDKQRFCEPSISH